MRVFCCMHAVSMTSCMRAKGVLYAGACACNGHDLFCLSLSRSFLSRCLERLLTRNEERMKRNSIINISCRKVRL